MSDVGHSSHYSNQFSGVYYSRTPQTSLDPSGPHSSIHNTPAPGDIKSALEQNERKPYNKPSNQEENEHRFNLSLKKDSSSKSASRLGAAAATTTATKTATNATTPPTTPTTTLPAKALLSAVFLNFVKVGKRMGISDELVHKVVANIQGQCINPTVEDFTKELHRLEKEEFARRAAEQRKKDVENARREKTQENLNRTAEVQRSHGSTGETHQGDLNQAADAHNEGPHFLPEDEPYADQSVRSKAFPRKLDTFPGMSEPAAGRSSNTIPRMSESLPLMRGKSNTFPEMPTTSRKAKAKKNAVVDVRVQKLVDQVRTAREERNGVKNHLLCHICEERPVQVLFLICRHFVTCKECGERVRDCPTCHQDIAGTVDVFMG